MSEYLHYESKIIICSSCKSKLNDEDLTGIFYCSCRKTFYSEIVNTFYYQTDEYEFRYFVDYKYSSVVFNDKEFYLKDYCIINKPLKSLINKCKLKVLE